MAVLAQVLGGLLLVAAVAVWSWPVALGLAGLLLMGGGALAESMAQPMSNVTVNGRRLRQKDLPR